MWDYPGRDWPQANCERVESMSALCDVLVDDQPLRVSYKGRLDSTHFGEWASVVLAWSQFAPCCVVAEELADVVHPGKAPSGWGELVRGGMAYGVKIVAITQRIQETDKTIFGNATTVRVFRLSKAGDAQYLQKEIALPAERITSLKALEYIEKDIESGAMRDGKITF